MGVDLLELERSLVRESFYDFVVRFWDVVVPTAPVWNWHIEKICGVLQETAERYWRGDPKRDLVINIPPGSTKSTLCSVMFQAWTWTREPKTRHICSSYTDKLAMSLARKCRDVVTSARWQRLFPEITLRDDQNAVSEFANNHGGARLSRGTGSTILGLHGDFVTVDDPIDPLGVLSDAELKVVNDDIAQTLPNRVVHKGVSPLILVMQRIHQRDPSAMIIENAEAGGGDVLHVKLPAEVDDDAPNPVRPALWRRFYVDGLLDPVRIRRDVLGQFEIKMGRFAYSGQMLQDPVPPKGGMFEVDKLTIEAPPPLESFLWLVRSWDKAGTPQEQAAGKGAYTVGVLMGKDAQGRFWILDVVRGQWGSADRENMILLTAKTDGDKVKIVIEQEPGSGGKESAENTVSMLAGFVVYVERPTGSKVARADPFSVQVNRSNARVATGPWNKVYVDEMRFFPLSGTKDQIDASSMAFTVITRPDEEAVTVGGFGVLRR